MEDVREVSIGPEVSPYNLFQERYRGDPWRLLCCVICLNLCTGTALESVHLELFRRWPTSLHMATASIEEVEGVVRYLGLQRRRAISLIRMSTAFACWWDGGDPEDLPGIGKYGADSYEIFVRGNLSVRPQDKELRKYLEWMERRAKSV